MPRQLENVNPGEEHCGIMLSQLWNIVILLESSAKSHYFVNLHGKRPQDHHVPAKKDRQTEISRRPSRLRATQKPTIRPYNKQAEPCIAPPVPTLLPSQSYQKKQRALIPTWHTGPSFS